MYVRRVATMVRRSSLPTNNPWLSLDPYCKGNVVRLDIHGSNATLDATIVHPFKPFTNSASLLVNIPHPHSSGLPRTLVLKLADRRVVNRPYSPPWSPDVERSFQMDLQRYLERHGAYPEDDPESDAPLYDDLRRWQNLSGFIDNEASAYSHLSEAQSLGLVPRFYGRVRVTMSEDPNAHPSVRFIDGLLIEYISGGPMDSIRVGEDISVGQAEEVSQRVIALSRQLRRYGVSHGDIHLGNIILRKETNAPVLIDWGLADSERAGESLADRWNDTTVRCDYESAVRIMLSAPQDPSQFWHRTRTPVSDSDRIAMAVRLGGDAESWKFVNMIIRTQVRPHELQLFYYEDTTVDEDKGLRWRLKRGVKSKMLNDPVPVS